MEQTQVSQDIPASVREYASKYKLGILLMPSRDYRLVRLSLAGQIVRIIGLLGVAGCFFKWYIDAINLDRAYPLPASNPSERLFLEYQHTTLFLIFFLALFALVYGLFLGLYYREARRRLYLFQGGLLRLGNHTEEVLYWNEVADMYGASDKLVSLRREDGTKFKIAESWPHSKAFDQSIARILAERLLPETIERFERGLPISFGLLLISRGGIRYGGIPISWSDLEDVREKDGALMFKTKERWWKYRQIDAPLVMGLMKHAMRSRLVALLAMRARQVYQAQGTD